MVQLNHSMIKTRSVQPLWTVEQSNITPLYSQCSTQPIGVAFHLLVTDGRYILDSLPGNGIIGIVFFPESRGARGHLLRGDAGPRRNCPAPPDQHSDVPVPAW